MKIERVTPLLFVETIEPVLSFWQNQLGYQQLTSVPHQDKLGFVLLALGEQHLMLQTHASLREDLPAIAALGVSSALYINVDSLEAALQAVQGAEVIVPTRTTFYGAREAAIRDASGQVSIFSEHHGA
jgi:uncharacterized glyoxalase superfamily protein PhnB